jgi:hypothetical protein
MGMGMVTECFMIMVIGGPYQPFDQLNKNAISPIKDKY